MQAARLGLGADTARSLYELIQFYQMYPNGYGDLGFNIPDFSFEQAGVTALTLSEMLVQEHGGVIHVGAAIPPGWTMSGAVSVASRGVIDVDAVDGELLRFSVHAGDDATMHFVTPWSGKPIRVSRDGKPMKKIDGGDFTLALQKSSTYRFDISDAPAAKFAAEDGPTVKTLDRASIGLGPPCCAPPEGYDPHQDIIGHRDPRRAVH